MIEPLLRRLIEHKRRKLIVIILTILTGLLVVLPAADEYNAAKERTANADSELAETRTKAQGLPQFEATFGTKIAELKALESRAVSNEVAQQLREQLVQIVRETGCTMRQIRLGDASRRDWTTEDDPVRGVSITNRGDPTAFQLETRKISLSISGPMPHLHHFLARLSKVDKMLHTREMSLNRSDGGENSALLNMDILLFDLAKKVEE